jgi:hypothetical protein
MNRFVCLQCGRFCYSAAKIEDMNNDRCPRPGCGGQVVDAENRTSKPMSCVGCVHDLGGGCCQINVERECREGGGYELWEAKDEQADS